MKDIADTDYTKKKVEKRIINTAKADKTANIEANRDITRKKDSYNYKDIKEKLEELVKLV